MKKATKKAIEVGDIVHMHISDEALSDMEADAIGEIGSRNVDKYMEKVSDRTRKWKVKSIEECGPKRERHADLQPVGFKCNLMCMMELEFLVHADKPAKAKK